MTTLGNELFVIDRISVVFESLISLSFLAFTRRFLPIFGVILPLPVADVMRESALDVVRHHVTVPQSDRSDERTLAEIATVRGSAVESARMAVVEGCHWTMI